jgi:hypothetical protein
LKVTNAAHERGDTHKETSMKNLVYFSLVVPLVCFVARSLDDSLEKTTIGSVLVWVLTGLLAGVMYKYLEERNAPKLSWVVAPVVILIGLLSLGYVCTMLGIPVE